MPIVEIKSKCARTEANKRIPIQSTDRKGRLCLLTTGGLIRVRRLTTHVAVGQLDYLPVEGVGATFNIKR